MPSGAAAVGGRGLPAATGGSDRGRAAGQRLVLVLQAALFAVLCAAVQCGLALVRPGVLGFGDVTVTLVMGLAVGTAGLWGVVVWWLAMGVLGLVWMLLWRRFDWQGDTPMRARCRSRR